MSEPGSIVSLSMLCNKGFYASFGLDVRFLEEHPGLLWSVAPAPDQSDTVGTSAATREQAALYIYFARTSVNSLYIGLCNLFDY